MRAYFFAPIIGSHTFLDPARGLYHPNPRGGSWDGVALASSMPYTYRDIAFCGIDADTEIVREIAHDKRCHFVSTEDTLELQLYSSRWIFELRAYLEQHSLPADWLSFDLNIRQVIYRIALHSILPMRFELVAGDNIDARIKRCGATLDSRWSTLDQRLKEELVATLALGELALPARIDPDVRLRQVLRAAAEASFGQPMYVCNHDFRGPVKNYQAAIAAAYGDNRTQTATDPFTSSIDAAAWDNGYDAYALMAWNAANGGVVTGTVGSTAGMRRISTIGANQYSTITAQLGTTGTTLGAACRMHLSSTSEAAYLGSVNNYSSDTYNLEIIADGITFSDVAAPITWSTSPIAAGETITCEAEGTTIRFGTAEGGADTQRLTGTNSTLTGAGGYTSAGLVTYIDSGPAVDNLQITSWAGGTAGAAGDTLLPQAIF